MKRKADIFHGQSSVKKSGTSSSSADVFRSKIATKLLTFLDTNLIEFNKEKNGDGSQLKKESQGKDLCLSGKNIKSEASEGEDCDPLTKSLQNFIDTAKNRFSELFNKENKATERNTLKHLKTAKEDPNNSGSSSRLNEGSLQAQISKKLHCLLKKTFDKNVLRRKNTISTEEPDVQVIEEEWKKDVSVLFENFVNSSRKKFNLVLSQEAETNRDRALPLNNHLKFIDSSSVGAVNSFQADNLCSKDIVSESNSKAPCRAFKKISKARTRQSHKMEFEMSYEPKSFDPPTSHGFASLDYGTGSGILLMDEAQHAPDVLNLEVILDEPESEESSSEPEVLCLGEKVPTYEVVTIEEDDDDEDLPSVPAVQNIKTEKTFDCSHCDKSYKVESLLKFHIRMHGPSLPHVQLSRLPPEDADSNNAGPTENGEAFFASQQGSSEEKKKHQRSKKGLHQESKSRMKSHKKKHSRQHRNRNSLPS